MTRIFLTILGFVFAIGLVYIVISEFVWPSFFGESAVEGIKGLSELGARVREFQTLIGAGLATVAAIATAGVVYVSASIPIEFAKQRQQEIEKAQRQAGAAVLFAAISELYNQLQDMMQARGEYTVDGRLVRPIEPHPTLLDMEVIGTQSPEIIADIAYLLAMSVGRTPIIPGAYSPDYDRKANDELEIAFDFCGKVMMKTRYEALGRIGPRQY